ncbi:YafY family protein [Prevotella sp. MGM1]|uniref:helix-turn-helix transcriptional regulator n=1 Tax=Prevotella sp. MGM1 TaxID=2033405 RepID=UPI000CE9FA64|nr:WYL domain-containing transcriptional regulator [Prevotella sp. MGM1]GAY27573.1 WYL domain-containing protein [Prevotella sp. MGM1]
MRHSNLDRELSLMLLMTENRDYTVQQMCERLGISRRTLYYYIDFFRDSGFTVEKRGTCYSLDKNSQFFTRLFKKVHFTEDEAITMRRLLDRASDNSLHVQHLKNKLTRLYDLDILENVTLREQDADNVSTLYDAIKMKKTVILRNYSSPHSNTTANRVVEPFMFMDNNNEIRCYEIASGQNKTFKISRIESVMILADDQIHEARHKKVFTDIFMFSGEKRLPVTLRLGRLARNIMLEEYPQSAAFITPDDASHWIVSLDVCSYLGISRFVLGLFESVEILGSEEFREYIRMKIDNMKVDG